MSTIQERWQSPFAIVCRSGCGTILLSDKEFAKELARDEKGIFRCPVCKHVGDFHHENFERRTGETSPFK